MMYSIDVYIRTNNQGLRTAVKNILPRKEDPKVNPYEYRWNEGKDEWGIETLNIMIRFDSKDDRDDLLNSLKGLNGVINACESGSYVRPHLCGGDAVPCTIEDGGVFKPWI